MYSILRVLALLCAACALPFGARAIPPDPTRLEALERAIASDELKQIRSVVLQVDGRVVYEGYFNGADAETLHDVRSVSKSVTALPVGAATGSQAKKKRAEARFFFGES
ncbi:TPA: serine hydrolase, partial [Stenotrophomonas maltophilia]|nr:serine hydrolase [Stenotrophomonas maltophilia]